MKYLFLILFSSFAGQTIAQDSTFSRLVTDAIQSLREMPTIYYVDSSITFGDFSQFARKQTVEGFIDLRKGNKTSLQFTKAELKQIDGILSDQVSILWPARFFSNSVRIGADTLEAFIRKYRTSEQLRNEVYQYFYMVSQPVFIRNNSITIFRLAEMIDTSAGNDYVFIYIYDDDGWKRKMTIPAGSW